MDLADAMVAYRFCLGAEGGVEARCEAERQAFFAAATMARAAAPAESAS
ncbi:MAG: hypothetical protein AB7M12_00310 [Hyphomonadaceae bacterium]